MAETDLRARELELEYRSFLDDEARDGIYKGRVEDMIKRAETRLIVNINDIRKNPNFKDRAKGLIEDSVEELVAFHRALKEYVISIDPVFGKTQLDFHVGLCGSFGACHVTPRTLTCSFMNKTVCVEGIVSKISLVKPKPLKSVLYCPVTQKYVERRHYDLASLDYQPTSMLSKDLHDENGNPLELECGLSKYKNHQTLTLQEMPERTPSGQLPRCVDVVLEYDLVDKCKPGDRVQVVGSYRSLPNKQGNFTNGIFRTIVIGNHVELMSKEVSMTLTDEDINNCKRISRSRRSNIFDRLALSLAPSIHGHQNVKKALLCLLLGGVEKHLPNGSRLRGDINILLIGDPSVAKSQLLRFVLGCAPRAIPTTGRGSSGVGLTAAVTTDPDTGDRRLEAGAMVLADRGIVCVDEFDKMSDIDRTAIHEVMEQGRVTICKAGIQARLNARCSVLAAANPVCGNYDPYKLPKDNIAMQDSLLSRFDLLFIMLDEHNRENDTHIAEHVSRIHRYRPQNELDGEPTAQNVNANYLTTMQGDKDDFEKTAIYEKHNPLLHGQRGMSDRHFSMDFLRKYIHIAKLVKPTLSREACEMISEHYWNLRNMDKEVSELAKTQPITARTLETMIRLATAHAKARLSTVVDTEDAGEAINLLQYCVYQKVLSKPKIKRRKNTELEDGASEFEDDEETCDSTNISTRKRRRTEAGPGGDTADSPDDLIEDAPMESTDEQPQVSALDDEEKEAVRPQLPKFKELLNDLARKNKGAMVLDLDLVYQTSTEQLELDRPRTEFLLGVMSDEGLLVLDNNCLFFT